MGIISDISQAPDFLAWFLEQVFSSFTYALIKFLLGIYAVVLLADIVLLLIQRGVSGDMRDTLYGMNVPREFINKKGKSELRRRWDAVSERLKSANPSDWKVAVIEGDAIIDDLIKRMNYPGDNLGERLDDIHAGQIENIEDLKAAHLVRNRIIHDESLELSKEEAERTVGSYEEFLRYFQALD